MIYNYIKILYIWIQYGRRKGGENEMNEGEINGRYYPLDNAYILGTL